MPSLNEAKVIVEIIVPLGGLALATVSALWAGRQWKYQHITREWGRLIQFLIEHPRYMRPDQNANYRAEYHDEEAQRYELVARLCIAYLDDVYHLGLARFQANWLAGSANLLLGRHKAWFADNTDSYSGDFVSYMNAQLRSRESA